jgi:hypothetical protein
MVFEGSNDAMKKLATNRIDPGMNAEEHDGMGFSMVFWRKQFDSSV